MTVQWPGKYLPRQADGRPAVVAMAAVAVATAVLVIGAVVLTHAPPDVLATALGTLPYVILGLVTGDLLRRVRALEHEHQSKTHEHGPGLLLMLVEDAKAASTAAGNDESATNAIAKEVLVTCVRRSGGWKP